MQAPMDVLSASQTDANIKWEENEEWILSSLMTPPIPPVFDGKFLRSKALLLLVPLVMAGCSTPAVRQQRLVAKPNMTFADSAVFGYNSPRLLPQIGPGFPGGDASQNSGCSSCR